MKTKLKTLIEQSLKHLGVPEGMIEVNLDHPNDEKYGDYSTNAAMLLSKSLGASAKNPLEMAEKLAVAMRDESKSSKQIEKIEAVPPGFVNIFLTRDFFARSVVEVLEKAIWYGKNSKQWNKKVIIEYTDPNPFKPFHIGHLMSNAIGESLSRLLEFQDAKVVRSNYSGDVGLHIAKAIWGILKHKDEFPQDKKDVNAQIEFIGRAYVEGSAVYEEDKSAQKEIQDLNKKIYDRSDPEVDEIYVWGKKISDEHFKDIYRKLGSIFDYYLYESDMVEDGMHVVKAGLDRGVFEKSEGAIIFPGEKFGLHNRVFVNSQGLPTYETKELGLTRRKFELHDFDQSIIITANEQNDYFKVLKKVLELIYPEIAERTVHIGHGMMRFASGKMSSRRGNVITGESLLFDMEEMAAEKVKDRELSDTDKKSIAEKVAVAAIKFSILKNSIGKDIVFDPEKSISFEGDSGPYVQYTYVRAKSVLAKAKEEGIKANANKRPNDEISEAERLLYRFPEIVERAAEDRAPNYIATYLTQLAAAFNSSYASTPIVVKDDPASAYRVALTEATSLVLKVGLWLLGIETPEKM